MGALGSRASAGAWQPLVASLAGGVRVTGYAFDSHPPDDAGTASAPAGSTVHLHLAGTTPVGTRLAIRLTDAADTDWADWQTALGSGQADVALALPPDMPPGLYTVRLGAGQDGSANFNLAAAQLVRLLPINGTLDIGPLIVTPATQPTPRQTSVAPAAWPDRVRLLTPIVPRSVHAGEALSLQWVWQAAGRWRATERLTEAVHLIDANGHVLDAADMEPDGGYYPTTFWQPNERILDHPSLAVPADTPPGSYAVSVELLSGGHTLPAQSDTGTPLGDAVVVGHVDILPPATPAPFGGASVSVGPLRVQLTEAPGPAVPGTALAVPLRWHLPAAPIAGQSLTLELQQSNRVLASTTIQPGGASYPLSRWRTGETERQVVDLPIPAGAPPGPADLILMGSPDGTPQRLGTVTIAGRPHVFTASPTVVLNLPFANGSVLLGFDLRADGATVGQGQTPTARRSLDVTLYWKAGGPTPSPLKVTVQLLDATNHLAAQDDTEPEGGRAPSTSWLAGEVITSTHHVDLAKTPAGTYRLITALYDAKTGARVATAGGNTAALTTVAVP